MRCRFGRRIRNDCCDGTGFWDLGVLGCPRPRCILADSAKTPNSIFNMSLYHCPEENIVTGNIISFLKISRTSSCKIAMGTSWYAQTTCDLYNMCSVGKVLRGFTDTYPVKSDVYG